MFNMRYFIVLYYKLIENSVYHCSTRSNMFDIILQIIDHLYLNPLSNLLPRWKAGKIGFLQDNKLEKAVDPFNLVGKMTGINR